MVLTENDFIFIFGWNWSSNRELSSQWKTICKINWFVWQK